MPLISNNDITVYTDTAQESFKIKVFYNNDFHFYTLLPEKFKEQFDTLDEKTLEKYSANKHYSKRFLSHTGDGYRMVISGEKEVEALENTERLLKHLINITTLKKDVIIIDFSKEQEHSNRDSLYGSFRPLKLEYGLIYCTEVKTSKDAQTKYYKYTSEEWFGENKIHREEVYISSHRKNYVIIDDTVENRAFLENIYSVLDNVGSQLKKYIGTNPENFLEALQSGNKLIETSK